MRLLREADADPDLAAVLETYQDYRAGVLSDWPEGYAEWVVEGVRYLDRQSRSCTAELHSRLNERMKRRESSRRSNVQ